MKALIVQADRTVKVEEVPKPQIASDEILVKVVAIGQNPTDWKHAAFVSRPGVIIGCDFAGIVEAVGADVTTAKIGDRWAGGVHGGQYEDVGGFAEYVKLRPQQGFRIPDNLSFEQAATVGVACFTGVQTLYNYLGLPVPGSPPANPQQSILVWSAATSVGLFTIQLAKLSGLKVYATASKENHELVRSLGADFVIDYKENDVAQKIRAASNDSIEVAIDCISENDTIAQVADAVSSRGARVIVLLGPDTSKIRKEVQIIPTLLYTALGREFEKFGRTLSKKDTEHHESFTPIVSRLFEEGKLKTPPIRLLPGGLSGVQAGFDYMRAGKVKAEKLVYTL